jgi:hypothetical protein
MARKSYAEINGKNSPAGGKGNRLREVLAAQQASTQPDWGRIDMELLWKVIQATTSDDGAVMFGYSRDGGAYSVKIYDGGEPMKEYFHRDEELIEFLLGILEVFNGS